MVTGERDTHDGHGTRGTRGTGGARKGTGARLVAAAAASMAVAVAVIPGNGATAQAADGAPEAVAAVPQARITLGEQGLGLGRGGLVTIDDTHRTPVPDDPAYAFLGTPGTQVWEITDAPWDTSGIAPGGVRDDTVRWSLAAVDGPGTVAVYETTGARPLARFDSADGLPDGYDLPTGASGDTRWAFDAAGVYTLTFTAAARERDGAVLAASVRYEVRVGGDTAHTPAMPSRPSVPPTAQQDATGTATPAQSHAPESPVRALTSAARQLSEARTQAAETQAAQGREAQVSEARLAQETAEGGAGGKADTTRKVLDNGHIDFAARIVDGKMQIHIKDGTVAGKTTWREPSSVVLHVKPAAKKEIPDGDDFAFLGRPGDPVWLLDQVQQDGQLWPGWSTENIEPGKTKGTVGFKLAKAEGPGVFALYNYDGMSGATIRFNSGDGVPDTFDVPQNTHAHGGWAFGKEGVYRLTFTMSGTLANGSPVSDTETVAFVVGETDPNTVQPGGGTGNSGDASPDSPGGGVPGADSGADGGASSAGNHGGGAADGGGDGVRTADGGKSGSMAHTGADGLLLIGATAAGLAAAGTGFVVVTRRGRRGTA
ncbi:TIGR03773 family transporter-associated surface protein [Streptomyces sp. GMY02]|uniref:TIGR03773 family transporter-associated surface protein n=1 Tax=Streptomyces sp. GMY02 TaxID=1333528 RepID=UPI001C2BC77E|nr:TIGR03773 family transporter-associated surface protein [Streptomyces sp. GMY02]QXE33775.1 TIGR03773 family transporter-associated surface protein [Streptomyces sp. GMY02]